ncbi:MAG TPA: tryptophan synthase subunit alpha [Acidobacteriota bacterium]|nr:tryptophan synthase subunit alpha [Acidobacteriota bacterium]
MNRIRTLLSTQREHKLLVPFFTAGYPDLNTVVRLAEISADCGADIVELGVPFSDPLADGPDIQYSSSLALRRGVNLARIFRVAEKIRRRSDIPLVLMGYYNPIHAYGPARFVRDAVDAGIDGYIVADLPVEEASLLKGHADRWLLSSIFLVAPTSSPERVRMIDAACTDIVYAVTVTGVTGAGRKFDASTDRYLKNLRRLVTHPFVAGFGVSSPKDARRMTRYADGVVIGSVLTRLMRTARTRAAGVSEIRRFLGRVRRAIP